MVMTQGSFQTELEFKPRGRSAPSDLGPAGSAEGRESGNQELFAFQTALLELLGQANQRLFDRMSSESVFIMDFAAKMGRARSIPDAAATYGDLSNRHMEMAFEDAGKLAADTQKLMRASPLWSLKSPNWGRGSMST